MQAPLAHVGRPRPSPVKATETPPKVRVPVTCPVCTGVKFTSSAALAPCSLAHSRAATRPRGGGGTGSALISA